MGRCCWNNGIVVSTVWLVRLCVVFTWRLWAQRSSWGDLSIARSQLVWSRSSTLFKWCRESSGMSRKLCLSTRVMLTLSCRCIIILSSGIYWRIRLAVKTDSVVQGQDQDFEGQDLDQDHDYGFSRPRPRTRPSKRILEAATRVLRSIAICRAYVFFWVQFHILIRCFLYLPMELVSDQSF